MGNDKTSVKKRNWCFFIYPTKEQLDKIGSIEYDGSDGYGSVPDDWKQRLQLSGLQYAISPIHDKDLLEDGSGKTKKPHYHVIVCYGSPTTYRNVKNLTDSFNSPIPQYLEQVRGYYRYFTHLDNPEKFQYDEKDICVGGGFNIADFTELTKSEVLVIKMRLRALIREKDISEYDDFMQYVDMNGTTEEQEVAGNNTIHFNAILTSRRYKNNNRYKRADTVSVDRKTGEVIE